MGVPPLLAHRTGGLSLCFLGAPSSLQSAITIMTIVNDDYYDEADDDDDDDDDCDDDDGDDRGVHLSRRRRVRFLTTSGASPPTL